MANSTPFEIPEQMRQMADRSVDQARKAFGDFIEATQKAVSAADTSSRSAQTGMGDVGRQALAYAEENVAATFDLASRLVHARTMEEMAALQQEFLRRQMEAVTAQSKGMTQMLGRVGEGAKKTGK